MTVSHRNDVDGLRAVAVLGVLIYHFNFGFLSGGFTGVDVFFVISGFVISNSIVSDIDSGKFSVVNFYFKRFRRIIPAYIAVVLLATIAATIILLPDDLLDYAKSEISAGLYYSNFYFWKTSGYFQAAAHTKPLLHTWSLAVEEQFYIFAPLLIWGIHRYFHRRWIAVLLPIAVLSFISGVAAIYTAPTAGFFLLPTRAWELLTGSLVALAGWRLPENRLYREGAALVGAALILFGMVHLIESDPFPGWNALLPCVGTALIILAGKNLATPGYTPSINRLLATSPFVWIGLISYSLYLVHWPIVSFMRYLSLREPTIGEGLLMLAASVALAWLSWRFVERPFRVVNVRRRAMVFAGAAMAAAISFMIGEIGILNNGFPERFPNFALQQIHGVEDWGGETCFNQNPAKPIAWNSETCTRIHGTGGRILLWGDSFAAHYIPGILQDSRTHQRGCIAIYVRGLPADFLVFLVCPGWMLGLQSAGEIDNHSAKNRHGGDFRPMDGCSVAYDRGFGRDAEGA